jgi:hypothetical protein
MTFRLKSLRACGSSHPSFECKNKLTTGPKSLQITQNKIESCHSNRECLVVRVAQGKMLQLLGILKVMMAPLPTIASAPGE